MSDFAKALPTFAELAEGVRRIVAPNPSMMTGPGTNTYLFGVREIAVVDPGPRLRVHIDDIIDKAGAPVRWVLATHTHPDHSPGVRLLAEKTGAEVLGMPAPEGEHQDASFRPTRVLADGDRLETAEFVLEAIHTPGHASNHLCFRHPATNWILTGDHVIDGSTVVINPPDGNMSHDLESLRKVKALRPDALLPGHGDRIVDPDRLIDWIIGHRLEREAKVLAAVKANAGLTTRALVPIVYEDVPPKLYAWAERSLLAHLEKLAQDRAVVHGDDRWRAA
ncbi:MAG: MBL fold metallo-hydrolase [Woeseiaceae bacterium]|nr:MBL fold metallo-hydrolase [Woeseiaceae bacterium]